VSRLRRALAATTLAAVAAGGALLTAAAAPAHAATPAAVTAPAGGHMLKITAQRAGGISPQVIEPCAVPASTSPSQITPASCLPKTITCWLDASAPTGGPAGVIAGADVRCDNPVSDIIIDAGLILNHSRTLTEDANEVQPGATVAVATATSLCLPGTYTNGADASIVFPDGYSPSAATLHQSPDTVVSLSDCAPPPPPGGGGGGGGCAITSPSSTAQPPAVRPRLISCP
jgi:hypothetical protein